MYKNFPIFKISNIFVLNHQINRNHFLGEGVVFKPYDYTTHVTMAIICATTFMAPVVLLTMSLCLEKMTGAYTRCLVGGKIL